MLVNRQRCEERARNIGWVPSSTLTTVEDEAKVGPGRLRFPVWVAIEVRQVGRRSEGTVQRRGEGQRARGSCVPVRRVHSQLLARASHDRGAVAKDEAVLASRLAVASARIVQGISLDASRAIDNAVLPRDKPAVRP